MTPPTRGDATAAQIATLRTLSPAAFGQTGGDHADAFWQAVARAHGTRYPRGRGRHYHTLAHVVEVAERYAEVAAGPGWADPLQVWLAVLLHDAVYDVGRRDNEARSAAMCEALAQRWLGMDATRAAALIRLTAAHGHLDPAGLDADACHFLDCDMAILGAAPERYAQYERDVAAEYTAIYAPPLYEVGRRAFLEGLLASERIFLSDWFHARLEARARANIAARLAADAG